MPILTAPETIQRNHIELAAIFLHRKGAVSGGEDFNKPHAGKAKTPMRVYLEKHWIGIISLEISLVFFSQAGEQKLRGELLGTIEGILERSGRKMKRVRYSIDGDRSFGGEDRDA